ncbi:isochorismatase family cysteine hydrolase [Sphingomonas sp. 8AM]|uniref:isochorismatase family cysteine hydrolase n=1 Tax=Sphingomonas sp. 8AM TaxID=2653170 RepID=UPI0012EF0705|nr:isochorismatase family cysteine hydrolase [Sphingomonas sp. 8AM]VXD02051.1 Uncharacterized isochorismatase family protein YaaI [Sphingomonas sp. 8AM]
MADAQTPSPGASALLIIDMINDLAFDGGEDLAPAAIAAAKRISDVRDAADAAQVPVIYVNDNFGDWLSERGAIVDHCRAAASRGKPLIDLLHPRDGDYFVVKPQFSGFYATNLPVLLPQLGVSRLILTGIAADICVLFTAADAHMRDYDLWVPEDTVASEQREHQQWALELMRHSMCAETAASDALPLSAWLERA